MTLAVDVISDVICPWCYIGKRRLEKAIAAVDVQFSVRWHPFQLNPAIIQIIKGEAELTVGEETVAGKPGTWIQMAAKTPHSVKAQTPMVMLLTLLETGSA